MTKKVSKKTTKEKVEKVKPEIVEEDDEPSWYHYVFVLLIIAGLCSLPYFAYLLWGQDDKVINMNSSTVTTTYPYVRGNVTYNLQFHNSIEELEAMDFPVEPTKLDILNTIKFKMSFLEYNGTDNGQVLIGYTKMMSFLKRVYFFNFDEESFYRYNQTNCMNSTKQYKVMVFDPYSDREGVFYNQTNGCIEFLTNDPTHIVDLVDKLMYEVVTSE